MKMKNHRKNNRLGGFLFRIGMIVVTLAVLGGVLSSCAGGKTTPTLTVNEQAIVVTDDNGLTQEQITLLALNIRDKADNPVTVREQLVAALRGYDMTADGFDDENLPEAHPENAAVYALNVLNKHGVPTINSIEAVTTQNATNTEDSTAEPTSNPVVTMTPADVQTLVNCFKTTVATEESIGFFTRILTWIALGFEWMINVLGFGSFILGTFIFAVLVELLMLPLAIHQQKNARKQARLRPKEMAIRRKYAGRNDQKTMQEMQQEIQTMYQNEGINPMTSGCLPLLISLPVVYALYYIVIDPLKYMMSCPSELASALTTFATAPRAAGGLGLSLQSSRGTIEILSYLRELGGSCPEALGSFQYFTNSGSCLEALNNILTTHAIPNFSIGPVNFGLTPSLGTPSLLWLIPVLTFGVYFGSMKLTRRMSYQPTTANDPNMGCSNTIMDVSMPIISAVFTFMVPGAVGVYWIFKSLLSTLKQFIMSRVMPLPKFTEADYRAAEKELAAKEKGRPAKKPSGTRNPNVRSLHHIDDEDFETPAPQNGKKGGQGKTPEIVQPEPQTETPATPTAEAETSKGAALVNSAPLKEDTRERKEGGFWKKKKKKDAQAGDASQDEAQSNVSETDEADKE